MKLGKRVLEDVCVLRLPLVEAPLMRDCNLMLASRWILDPDTLNRMRQPLINDVRQPATRKMSFS